MAARAPGFARAFEAEYLYIMRTFNKDCNIQNTVQTLLRLIGTLLSSCVLHIINTYNTPLVQKKLKCITRKTNGEQ